MALVLLIVKMIMVNSDQGEERPLYSFFSPPSRVESFNRTARELIHQFHHMFFKTSLQVTSTAIPVLILK